MIRIRADAWPWQTGYDWRGQTNNDAPLNDLGNGRGARFGAGWNWKLGISVGHNSMMVDLLFGTIWIFWRRKVK